jgi:hypothetical protein
MVKLNLPIIMDIIIIKIIKEIIIHQVIKKIREIIDMMIHILGK